jgi:hypothetical protein
VAATVEAMVATMTGAMAVAAVDAGEVHRIPNSQVAAVRLGAGEQLNSCHPRV